MPTKLEIPHIGSSWEAIDGPATARTGIWRSLFHSANALENAVHLQALR